MIWNQWYGILDARQLKKNRPLGVTRMGEKLVLWRCDDGVIGCAADCCAHRGAQLSLGKVHGDAVHCPFHGFGYDASGRGVVIPANGQQAPVPERFQVRAYRAVEAHGLIWIWWGDQRASYPPLPFFQELTEPGFSYGQFVDHWPVHYSRAIENQLDVVHLPFVHHNTIGRGHRTVIDGPVVDWVDDELRVWVFNRVEDGIPARRAEELDVTDKSAMLRFRFGNIWRNRIADDLNVFACFAPIDDDNTMIYLRFYQRFLSTPVLGGLISRLAMPFNKRILRQDKRVVVTQRPIRSELRMGEKLVPGDRPIVAYRRRRQALQEANPRPAAGGHHGA